MLDNYPPTQEHIILWIGVASALTVLAYVLFHIHLLKRVVKPNIKGQTEVLETVQEDSYLRQLAHELLRLDEADEREQARMQKMLQYLERMNHLALRAGIAENDLEEYEALTAEIAHEIDHVIAFYSKTLFIREHKELTLSASLNKLLAECNTGNFYAHYREDIEPADLLIPAPIQALLLRLLINLLQGSREMQYTSEVWLQVECNAEKLRLHYFDENCDFTTGYYEQLRSWATLLNPLYPLQEQTPHVFSLDVSMPFAYKPVL